MNYSAEAIDRIAASYALGTLRGPARRRFEALCGRSDLARSARDEWTMRLADLARQVTPIEPSLQTWPAILRRLRSAPSGNSDLLAFPARRIQRPRWQQLAVAASLAVLAGSLGWFAAQQHGVSVVRQPSLAAVLSDATGRGLWRVAASADLRRLEVTTLGGEPIADDRSLELWALPRNGSAPISLGLLPRSRALSVALLETQRAALLSADKIAVTLEPRGGSRISGPSGPVVHVADLIRT